MLQMLKDKLSSLMSKVHENREKLGAAAPLMVLAALLFASNLGLPSAILLAVAGLLGFLSQITDSDENRLSLTGNLLIMASFLIGLMLGDLAQVLVILLAIGLQLKGFKK